MMRSDQHSWFKPQISDLWGFFFLHSKPLCAWAPETASEHCTGSLFFLGAGPRDRSFPGRSSGFLGVLGSKLTLGGPDGEASGWKDLPPGPRLTFLWVPLVGQGLWHRVPCAEPRGNQGFVSADERGGPLRDPVRAARRYHGPRRHLHQPRPGCHHPGGAGTTVSWPRAPLPAPSLALLPWNTSSLCTETAGQWGPEPLTRSCPGWPLRSVHEVRSPRRPHPAGIANLSQVSSHYILSSFDSSPHVVVGKIRKDK